MAIRHVAIAAVMCFCDSNYAVSAAMIPLVSATASTGLSTGGFERSPIHVVDGTGLNGDLHHLTPDGAMWLSNGTYAEPHDVSPWIIFDLGAGYFVDSMDVWNYSESHGTSRGIQTARISVAGADRVFHPFIDHQYFERATQNEGEMPETISLALVEARYIRFDRLTNRGDSWNFIGLSEVRFDGTLAPGEYREIPIPATIHAFSTESSSHRTARSIVNGVGLGGTAHSKSAWGTMWLSGYHYSPDDETYQIDDDPFVVFDLGQTTALDRMVVWNFNEAFPGSNVDHGLRQADLLIAGEDLVFRPLRLGQQFTIAPGRDDTDFGQAIDFGGVSARYIKLEHMVNHRALDLRVGLSEVQFYSVPEPATAALFTLALPACFRLFWRRR